MIIEAVPLESPLRDQAAGTAFPFATIERAANRAEGAASIEQRHPAAGLTRALPAHH